MLETLYSWIIKELYKEGYQKDDFFVRPVKEVKLHICRNPSRFSE